MADPPLPPVPEAPSPPLDDENPWPGLASFRERDALYFKGRDAEIDGLVRAVRAQRVTLLFGASGLGKTSLLQAGLGPQLRENNELAVHLRLDFEREPAPLMEQVFEEIRKAAEPLKIEMPKRLAGEPLWEFLHRRDAAFWTARNRLVIPVLVFDQFEELFSRGLDRADWVLFARRFISELADLAEGRPPEALMKRIEADANVAADYDFVHHRYRLVISLREDFLAPIEDLCAQMPSIASGRYRLHPMTGRQALMVADQTRGRLVETAVAEQIVRIAAGRPFGEDHAPLLDALSVDCSLLGLFCRELNLRRQAQGAATISAELVRAGQGNILDGFYEQCMGHVSLELRRFVEEELVTAAGYRDSRALEDAFLRAPAARKEIGRLIDDRLLRVEDRGGVRRLELSHDVLTRVVRESRDLRRTKERVWAEQRKRRDEELQAADKERLELARAAAWRARLLALALAAASVLALGAADFAQQESERANAAAEQAQRDAEYAKLTLAAIQGTLTAAAQVQQAASAALDKSASNRDPQAAVLLANADRTIQGAAKNVKLLQSCGTGPRVYVQVGKGADGAVVQKLSVALRQAGFIVPSVEVVKSLPTSTELRYFRPSDEDGATAATETLSQAGGLVQVTTKYVPGFENSTSVRPCQYELWLASSSAIR